MGRANGKIHLLLGANNAKQFSTPILCRELGSPHHVPWLSGISFYRTAFNNTIELGRAGINPELFDETFPKFVVSKTLAVEKMGTSTTHEERLNTNLPEQNMFFTERDDDDTEGDILTNVRTLKVDYEELQKFLETEGKPEMAWAILE